MLSYSLRLFSISTNFHCQVPLHTLIKITPVASGCEVEHIEFPVDGVDTHRPRPALPTHKRLRVSSETAAELSDRWGEYLANIWQSLQS